MTEQGAYGGLNCKRSDSARDDILVQAYMTILPGASLRAVFLSHLHQLVFPAAEADLLGVGQAGPVFGVGVGVVEVVVPVVEAGARHLVGQLAARQGSLP